MRWRILPNNGRLPLIDSLILRSEDLYMFSVSEFEERSSTFLHDGQFEGWLGAYRYGTYGHGYAMADLSLNLAQEHGISYRECFNVCCNPDTLEKGNLISMSRQVQAWFVQFCALPPLIDLDSPLLTLKLFPEILSVPAGGFMDIASYFIEKPKSWRASPLQRSDVSKDAIIQHLTIWRSQYTHQITRLLKTDCDKTLYVILMRALLEHSPEVFQEILRLTVPNFQPK